MYDSPYSNKSDTWQESWNMNLKNQIMLITYPDSLGHNLKDLHMVLKRHLDGVVGGVHILPFFPSSGDRGFSPMTYREVSPEFGTFEDIRALARDYYLMFDYMINHISAQSAYYQDFLKNKDASPWKDLFIRYKDFWEGGFPTQEQVDKIYKRKPRAPYVDAHFADGTEEKVWCTFSEEQIDLNVDGAVAKQFTRDNLEFLAEQGASIIRLDAFAYATKKADSNCFFVEPEIWELLNECLDVLKPHQVDILPEIHEHYSIQMKLAEHGHWVYDFALPMLVLHALYSGRADRLAHWMEICPRKQFTTLDTHDGIGVVDVKDLLTDEEIDFTTKALYERGANVKRKYSSAEYNNLDIYQINCTYYSALGNDDDAYLLARTIQLFAPGIPQVYYVGLLAGENDIELLEHTKEGRNINRHYYTEEEIEKAVQRPLLKKLFQLMRFRNSYGAFDGTVSILPQKAENQLVIRWENGALWTELHADLAGKTFSVQYFDEKSGQSAELAVSGC